MEGKTAYLLTAYFRGKGHHLYSCQGRECGLLYKQTWISPSGASFQFITKYHVSAYFYIDIKQKRFLKRLPHFFYHPCSVVSIKMILDWKVSNHVLANIMASTMYNVNKMAALFCLYFDISVLNTMFLCPWVSLVVFAKNIDFWNDFVLHIFSMHSFNL